MKIHLPTLCLLAGMLALAPESNAATAELKDLSINGGIENGKARLVIEAALSGLSHDDEKLLYATAVQHSILATRDKLQHDFTLTLDIIQGLPKEIPLTITGTGEIREVTGEGLLDWSVRRSGEGTRYLVLRFAKTEEPITKFNGTIRADTDLKNLPIGIESLALTPEQPAWFSGFVRIDTAADIAAKPQKTAGLVPVDLDYLPESMRKPANSGVGESLAFRFQGAGYTLPLEVSTADPEARRIVLHDFSLSGQLDDTRSTFTLSATARLKNPDGGKLELLSGNVALTEYLVGTGARLRFENGGYVLECDKPGEFPIRLKFDAAVSRSAEWNAIRFRVAPSVLQPVSFQGLAADTKIEFAGAAKPDREGNAFVSHLPADGRVNFSWKAGHTEDQGRLFYSVELLSQITISPGLMRQTALVEGRVMQGELDRMNLLLSGSGELTRVQGPQVLSWNVDELSGTHQRRLTVQFNQPQKEQFSVQLQFQNTLGAFPQTAQAVQIRAEDATRVAGYFRIVNEGAVRLEVVQSSGLSQISPEQFPESDTTRAAFAATGNQRFAYRFSGTDYELGIQADNILPELSVSQVVAYHLGETETTIDAEIELDIREAPIRELMLQVPEGYVLARLNASGLSDYFLANATETNDAELRLVYGQPMSGRQVIQLRLERNESLDAESWRLSRIDVLKSKSTRGHVGVSAEPGFRLTPTTTQGLTEIATAFFPKKLAGIQAGFRISDPAWQATVNVERLPQSIQGDVFHLFSIGEGIAYGSSTMNFAISGAPISTFQVELSDEYFNVEFTGKDIRNWQKTDGGYTVHLHTPVSGSYILLATYERPFKAQGDTLTFTGARPLDAQTEQGHTIVISDYQFQVNPVEVSTGLLEVEPAEVPSEYRLFFDAPILKAYRYTSRPFNLQLALSPLAQGETLSLVVDRATLNTSISKEGQVLTDVRYFVKNRGNPHLRLTLPEGNELWSATVNGTAVVPVKDGQDNLIPLPQRADPNSVLTLDFQLASRSQSPEQVTVKAPVVAAPVLLAEWNLKPDTGQRLIYREGSLTPAGGMPDISGFAGLVRLFHGTDGDEATRMLMITVVLLLIALWAWRWAGREGVWRFSGRHVVGLLIGVVAFVFVTVTFIRLAELANDQNAFLPTDLTLLAPVQQPGSALSVEVKNVAADAQIISPVAGVLCAVLALGIWIGALVTSHTWFKPVGWVLGWALLGWAVLRGHNGAPAFLCLIWIFLLVQLVLPGLWRLLRLPSRPPTEPKPKGRATAAASLIIALLALTPAKAQAADVIGNETLAESVTQQMRIEEGFVFATATIRWQAEKGELLPVLFEPAVLTSIDYPADKLKLVQQSVNSNRVQHLLALADGAFEITLRYQQAVNKSGEESGFQFATQFGLVNRVHLTVINQDVDITPRHAVSVEREFADGNTEARLTYSPAREAWLGWKPRSRDARNEKPVFFAELNQLCIPTSGVVDGLHEVRIRMAQGELTELVVDVPAGATVTDVTDGISSNPQSETRNPQSIVSSWRFDPDTRKLSVDLVQPQSASFTLWVRTQIATGPLPVEQQIGLLTVVGSSSHIGMFGIATGDEVQLDQVTVESLSPINLEDFPAAPVQALQSQVSGLTLRRAFRYGTGEAFAVLQAAPVDPDVRVATQETLSLGEDRVVLAVNSTVDVNRAGIFRLSFPLPEGLDVESVSGDALSHWTELRTESGRIITLHLQGKTLGRHSFSVSLSGPGLQNVTNWTVPRFQFREATKQQGQLVVVPEQGMRLQVSSRDGITQLDPQRSGIRQRGVLAFRLLQSDWALSLAIEQVDAWVQVTSLQHFNVSEAQVKVTANLQYQIENTGLKSFRVLIPTNAESVRFSGDQVADFLPVEGTVTNGMQSWEVKLHRRVIGGYLLQAVYQMRVPEQAGQAALQGVRAEEVSLQRGFVTLQSGGRLQVEVEQVPEALQPTEWQSIPRVLQQDLAAATASYTYRLVDPAFVLPIQIVRHEATKLLPARVRNVTLTSVISDDGVMLTQVRLDMLPGDKRLLHLRLPDKARFWFSFVNHNGAWPWRQQDEILIPLEQTTGTEITLPVEFFYSSQIGSPGRRSLDLDLLGPKFDLPLENITWQVYLNEKWELNDWKGTLQLQEDQALAPTQAASADDYLRQEASLQQQKTRVAEQWLERGNSLLQRGDPQLARRAFENAYGLSQHDLAFNEDARVQLHNLKVQQALLGLNVRQAGAEGTETEVAGRLRDLRGRERLNYTQQEAQQVFDSNTAEENTAMMRLAERIIQQQDAAVAAPAAIRASIPGQGRLLTFRRAVQVDPMSEMRLQIETSAAKTATFPARLMIVVITLFALSFIVGASRLSLRNER